MLSIYARCETCRRDIYKAGAYGSGWVHVQWFVFGHAARPCFFWSTTTSWTAT